MPNHAVSARGNKKVPMDLKTLKEQALVETGRFFVEKFGSAPAEDSEEWEDEYRRQFERLKNAAARHPAATPLPAALIEEPASDLPELVGAPADKRWATSLRSIRLKQIPTKAVREWLAGTWTQSKAWIDARELSEDAFARRVAQQYAEARRRSTTEAAAVEAKRQAQAMVAAELQGQIIAAGISAAKLVELVDVSPRVAPTPIKEKLAELRLEGRALRIFETADPTILMVLEKRADQKDEYGIERDEGLVADLKLFARSGL
jgi:hypothetical protein